MKNIYFPKQKWVRKLALFYINLLNVQNLTDYSWALPRCFGYNISEKYGFVEIIHGVMMGVSMFLLVIFPSNSFILHQNSTSIPTPRGRGLIFVFVFQRLVASTESDTPLVNSVYLVTLKSTDHVVPRETLIPWQPVSHLTKRTSFPPVWDTEPCAFQVCPACLSELYRDTPEFKG